MQLLRLNTGLVMLVCVALWGATPVPAQEVGTEFNKPVLGGACKTCPWGVLGDIAKEALRNYGNQIQSCYNCWQEDAPRIVADGRMPPALTNNLDHLPEYIVPLQQPKGPIEFGVTGARFVRSLYEGADSYANEKPRKNLRMFATIVSPPRGTIVAVRRELGITDLGQIKEKCWPVRILGGLRMGGAVGSGSPSDQPELRDDFDICIGGSGLANCPEFNQLYEVSAKYDLVYLQLPDELLDKLAETYGMERRKLPIGFLRGKKSCAAKNCAAKKEGQEHKYHFSKRGYAC